jgi:hypothetical protein
LASLVSILSAVRFMRSDNVDVQLMATTMQLTYEMFLNNTISERADGTVPDDRIVDSHFVDLMADPVAALQRTYEQLGLAWPKGHDRVITDYLRAKPKGKHGSHSYTLADVGLDEDSVRATFKDYVGHYGIAEE